MQLYLGEIFIKNTFIWQINNDSQQQDIRSHLTMADYMDLFYAIKP